MGNLTALILEILGIVKPLIVSSEYERLTKEYERLKEQNEKRKEKIKIALVDGDISALNILLSELLDLSD